MTKVTIFSSSNRTDNKTRIFSETYAKLLEEQGIESQVCTLEQLPFKLSGPDMYAFNNVEMHEIVEKYLKPVDKLVFVVPEYNGSFPGILKLFIDAIRPADFAGKKSALVGVSAGHSGCVRGMDHLSAILNYIKVDVYHHKLPIASINAILDGDNVTDQEVLNRLRNQISGFIKF